MRMLDSQTKQKVRCRSLQWCSGLCALLCCFSSRSQLSWTVVVLSYTYCHT